MPRFARYQGAIVRDDQMLLIQHTNNHTGRGYWLIPGGGIEPDETEEACVAREMWEETNLRVRVEGLLLDEEADPEEIYKRRKTYLCRIESGEAQPGYEPEPDAAAAYSITAVAWFNLRDPASWSPQVQDDSRTHRQLQRVRAALGYSVEPALS